MIRGVEVVAIVMGVFFAVGIGVGVLLVIALPALRSIWRRMIRRLRYGRNYMDGGNWGELPPRGDGKKPPHWPDRPDS
jgi:hypothetical protein